MLKIARLIIALLTLSAIGCQLVLHVGAAHSVPNFLSYFTNLANLFAALILLLLVFTSDDTSYDFARYVSAVNMAVVGLVFVALLRNADPGALLPWVNVILHYLMPVVVVLDWICFPSIRRLKARHVFLVLAFPMVYLAYTVIRGSATGWYPYPFLNPANVAGYQAVVVYAVGIAATFPPGELDTARSR